MIIQYPYKLKVKLTALKLMAFDYSGSINSCGVHSSNLQAYSGCVLFTLIDTFYLITFSISYANTPLLKIFQKINIFSAGNERMSALTE